MDKPLQSYKYQRKCRLARCNKDFGTNRKKQIFCLDLHRIEFHETKRKKVRSLYRRLRKMQKDLANIGKETEKLTMTMKKTAKESGSLADLLSYKKGGGAREKKKPNRE